VAWFFGLSGWGLELTSIAMWLAILGVAWIVGWQPELPTYQTTWASYWWKKRKLMNRLFVAAAASTAERENTYTERWEPTAVSWVGGFTRLITLLYSNMRLNKIACSFCSPRLTSTHREAIWNQPSLESLLVIVAGSVGSLAFFWTNLYNIPERDFYSL